MIEQKNWVFYTKDRSIASQYRLIDNRPVFAKTEAYKKFLESQTRYIEFYYSYPDSQWNNIYVLPGIAATLPKLKLKPHWMEGLYDYQEKAYQIAKEFTTKWLLIQSWTWSGKTFMMNAIYNWLDGKACFITFKTQVQQNINFEIQWAECYCLPTFKKMFKELNNWQALIIDETHSISDELRKLLCLWKWRVFWFTATPYRSDFEKEWFKIVFWTLFDTEAQALPVKVYQIKYDCVRTVEDALRCVIDLSVKSHHKWTDLLYKNAERTQFLVNLISNLLVKSKRVIVFTTRIFYRDFLYKILLEKHWPEKIFLLNKKMKKEELDRINSLDEYVLIANEQFAWEWVNIPSLNVWLLTFDTKNLRKIDQMVWRVRRKFWDKEYWKFVDVADIIRVGKSNPKYTWYNARKKIYSSLWYETN